MPVKSNSFMGTVATFPGWEIVGGRQQGPSETISLDWSTTSNFLLRVRKFESFLADLSSKLLIKK